MTKFKRKRYRKSLWLLIGAMSLAISGCGQKASAAKVAFITDGGSVEETGVNQAVWQGIVQYTEETQEIAEVYAPTEKSQAAYEKAMADAVANGADVVICAGEEFDQAVYDMQRMERETRFILLDGVPQEE